MIEISVVIPVYNEEAGLQSLFDRLYPALDALDRSYEIVFINDGSKDRSAALLRAQFTARPDVTRVVLFNGNYGQHMAIMAGFEAARGQCIVTLDADLQNPPEEIGKLVAKMDTGFDYVGTYRGIRRDTWFRRFASRTMNKVRERITNIRMTDQGSMLRAYSRDIVDAVNSCREVNTFIPALAYTFAQKPTEIEVAHEERVAGETKYSLYKLIRLNFDLMTGFSVVPLELFSFVGIVVSVVSFFFFVLLAVRRLVIGPEAEGLFTLFSIAFLLIGVCLFGIGLLGEYIGRIYQQVRLRPRYVVQAILERIPVSLDAPPGERMIADGRTTRDRMHADQARQAREA
ncbi:MAG: glycosyltransferase [Betaproteobacteria bacterium]|nr:glycosyltransferase [Betaproteobacteria bacterium]